MAENELDVFHETIKGISERFLSVTLKSVDDTLEEWEIGLDQAERIMGAVPCVGGDKARNVVKKMAKVYRAALYEANRDLLRITEEVAGEEKDDG